MKDCEEFKEWISAYVFGEAGEKTEEVRLHIDSCAACKTLLEEYRQTVSDMKALGKPTVATVDKPEPDNAQKTIERLKRIREGKEKIPEELVPIINQMNKSAEGSTDLTEASKEEKTKRSISLRWWLAPAMAAAGVILTYIPMAGMQAAQEAELVAKTKEKEQAVTDAKNELKDYKFELRQEHTPMNTADFDALKKRCDVDGDGKITQDDVELIVKELDKEPAKREKKFDTDDNGKVDSRDLMLLEKILWLEKHPLR